jgi:hypothetical protein
MKTIEKIGLTLLLGGGALMMALVFLSVAVNAPVLITIVMGMFFVGIWCLIFVIMRDIWENE